MVNGAGKLILYVLALFLFSDARLLAWRGTTGILEGRVRDKQTHDLLVGVNVLIMGTQYGAATDADGSYRINNIRAGEYDVRFSMVGYQTVMMKKVTILPDLRTRIDLELEQTTIKLDVIEVRAERPLIQKDLAATAFSIGELKLEKLPVSSFQEVLTLQPGTTLEGNVRGGKTNEVIFLIDGLPVQDVIGGGLGSNLPKSSITGLTMQTGGFEAEYGNALSGVVNVITKTGGNQHLLSLRLDRDNWLPNNLNKQQDHLTEVELSAGGPIVQDKLSYFSANLLNVNDTRWWQDFQNFFSSPVSRELSGFGKIEFLPSTSVRVGLQGIYSFRRWHDYEFSWRFNLSGLPERSRDSYRIALILSHTLSSNTFYTASLSSYYLRNLYGTGSPGDLSLEPYEYDFYLRYVINGKRNWDANAQQLIYTLKADLTTQLENMHIVKGGIELNQYDIFSDLLKYEPQTTYFGKPVTDAPLLNFSNNYSYRPRSGGVFLQDKIEIARDGSNISLGVRWDFLDPTAERPLVEFIPSKQNEYEQRITGRVKAKFKQQISPRVAFAGPVGPSSFIFANFGHYFQFPLFDYLYSGINPAQLKTGARNVLTGNPDLEPERSIAWEIGFKHGINENMVGSVTYFKKSFQNQIDAKTLIPFDSKSAGDYGFASYVNNAEANATGLEFVLSRERDERISGSLSYTYMATEGVSEYVDQAINYAQWGFALPARAFPLSWDQRHAFKMDVDCRLSYGVQSNLIVLYNSPRPYTFFPTRDGFVAADPQKVLLPNNARMKDVVLVHLKMSKQFAFGAADQYRLTIYFDGRNILNTRNVRWIDSNGRIGGELGDPSAYYDPRRVRVGAKLEY